MPIHYQNLLNWAFPETTASYSANDCIRYALSLGIAQDPLNATDLQYVYEEGLHVVPTFLSTVGSVGAWFTAPQSGIQWLQMLHGEQRMRFHGVVPPSATLTCKTRISHVVDKSAGRGALVVVQREWMADGGASPLATAQQVLYCRADGGFATAQHPGDDPLEALPAAPSRAPDQILDMPTSGNAALLYRLNGDRNPIHVLPLAAREAGFDRPILHGLCTYGMAARAILNTHHTSQPVQISSIAARFSAAVFPGETLQARLWFEREQVQFEIWVLERKTRVLSHGVAECHEGIGLRRPKPH